MIQITFKVGQYLRCSPIPNATALKMQKACTENTEQVLVVTRVVMEREEEAGHSESTESVGNEVAKLGC